MRISTLQAFNNGVSGLQRNYSDVTRTQEQISTGKRLLTPADDPVASVRLLQLGQEEAMNAQYKTGITAAKNSLTAEETILNSVGSVLQRVREIAVQAGNGGLDSTDKEALATELQQREDELLNLLNSQDASGKYLFSGSKADVQPFVRNADGTYSYQGDEGQREVQIASSSLMAIGDNGMDLFQNVFNANRIETGKAATGTDADGNPSTSRISLGLVTDKLAYDSVFPAGTPPSASDGVGIHFLDEQRYVVYDQATLPASYDWSTYDPSAPPVGELATGAIDLNSQSSDFIHYGGVKVQIDGKPQTGDDFQINRQPDQEKKGLLDVVADLRKALQGTSETQDGNYAIRDATAVALVNLDAVNAQVLSVQGKIGARLNTIDTTETFVEDVSLVNKTVQSELEDLDYAEALSRLSMQSTVLQAAQQSYVKISGLSLFNYL